MGPGIKEAVLSSSQAIVRIMPFLFRELFSQILITVLENRSVVGGEYHDRVVEYPQGIKTSYRLPDAPVRLHDSIATGTKPA